MADGTSPAARPRVGKIRSDQEHADLLTYHLSVIRAAEAKVQAAQGPVDEAKAELSDAQEELTKAFNGAKADLGRGYERKYLASLLLDGRTKIPQLVEFERQRARDKVALNQPVFGAGQSDMFPGDETPAEAKDEMAWEAEGYQRGLRGDLNELQDGDPPRFHQAIMRGYETGQKTTAERVARAMELRAAEATPAADVTPVNLDPPEPGTEAHEKAEKASIDRAKESLAAMGQGAETVEAGGCAPPVVVGAEPADDFETPAAELEKQTTRRAIKDAKAGATSGAAAPVH